MLRTRNYQEEQWDQILPDALHAIRSFLCTVIFNLLTNDSRVYRDDPCLEGLYLRGF